MSTPFERSWKLFGKRSLRLAAILLVLVATAAHAAPAPQSTANPPASAAERGELRRTIESRYEVLPVSGGIALKPRQPRAGIRAIEVTGEGVAVNGERVSPRTLRDWLGGDADAILRLQGLSVAEQRQVFGLDEEAAAGRPEPSAAETPATTSGEEAATSDIDVAEVPKAPEAPEAPAVPERPGRRSSASRVNVGGSVRVEKDETVETAVAVGGSVTVDGEVEEEVAAIGGPARINGRVGGDVTSVGSSVRLGPHAVVEGNVTSVGGAIHRQPGSIIHGTTSEVPILPWERGHRVVFGPGWGPWGFWGGVSDFMGSLMMLVLTGLLVCLVLLVARRPLERVDRQLVAQPGQSAVAGILGVIFFWPLLFVVTILLIITLVGCLLIALYPFLFLWIALLFLLGYTAVVYRLGRWLEVRFNRRFGGPYAVALAGLVAIQGWLVLGNLLDLLPGPFGSMVWLFGLLLVTAAVIVGFGAVILSRFGLEPGYWPRRGAPVPPPPYTPPPSYTPPPDHLPLTDPLTAPRAEEPPWEEPEMYPPPETEPSR
jgi:hypothetical protein